MYFSEFIELDDFLIDSDIEIEMTVHQHARYHSKSEYRTRLFLFQQSLINRLRIISRGSFAHMIELLNNAFVLTFLFEVVQLGSFLNQVTDFLLVNHQMNERLISAFKLEFVEAFLFSLLLRAEFKHVRVIVLFETKS